ncbi:MAG: putative manganese transporter [Bacteroidota bacterium]
MNNINFFDIFSEGFTITILVMVMMLIIEYINVKTRGAWAQLLNKNRYLQVFLAALIGLIPGCLGAFTIVSLYTHGIITLGAIVAAFSTTFGDEAFFMFSMIPKTTIIMSALLIVIATLTGWITDTFYKSKRPLNLNNRHFQLHLEDKLPVAPDSSLIWLKWKNFTFPRFMLSAMLIIYIASLTSGHISHNHGPEKNTTAVHIEETNIHSNQSSTEAISSSKSIVETHSDHEVDADKHEHGHGFEWSGENILFLVLSLFTLFIVLSVNEHFLEEHLWEHVIKKHFFKVFAWTFGALLLLAILTQFIDIENWVNNTKYAMFLILIIALLVGIIPESGPHYLFILLFIQGTIPFSILLANSIVQDGHGALPLLADSKRSFVYIKAINFGVGLLIGGLGLLAGF